MTKLLHSQAKDKKDNYLFINLLSDKSLDKLNDILGTNYKRHQTSQKIDIPEETRFKFFKRLMEVKPGFDKGDNGV